MSVSGDDALHTAIEVAACPTQSVVVACVAVDTGPNNGSAWVGWWYFVGGGGVGGAGISDGPFSLRFPLGLAFALLVSAFVVGALVKWWVLLVVWIRVWVLW